MGLRRVTVYHAVGGKARLCTSVHDEYVSHCPLVQLWCNILGLGEEISEVDGKE